MTVQFLAKTCNLVGLIGADHRDLTRSVRDLGVVATPPTVQAYFRGYMGQVNSGIGTNNFSATFDYADGDTYAWRVAKFELLIATSGAKSGKSLADLEKDYPDSCWLNPHYVGDSTTGPASNSSAAGYFLSGAVELYNPTVTWHDDSNVPTPSVSKFGLPGDGHYYGAMYQPYPGWRDTHFALADGKPCVSFTFDNDPFDATDEIHLYVNLLSFGWPAAWRKAASLRLPLL